MYWLLPQSVRFPHGYCPSGVKLPKKNARNGKKNVPSRDELEQDDVSGPLPPQEERNVNIPICFLLNQVRNNTCKFRADLYYGASYYTHDEE